MASVNYLVLWDAEVEEIFSRMERIRNTATEIIEAVEKQAEYINPVGDGAILPHLLKTNQKENPMLNLISGLFKIVFGVISLLCSLVVIVIALLQVAVGLVVFVVVGLVIGLFVGSLNG